MRKFLFGILFFFPIISFASTYGIDVIAGHTCSADSVTGGACSNANDGNTATSWLTDNIAYPHWIYFDLGANASTSYLGKLHLNEYGDGNGTQLANFDLFLSATTTSWGTSVLNATTTNGTTSKWEDYYFTPTSTAYRYVKLQGNSTWRAGTGYMRLNEMQVMSCLDCSPGSSTVVTSTEILYTSVMSPELDQLLRYLLEAGVVALVAWFVIKLFR